VVLGEAAVIETFVPTTWFNRVDLPTLGRPRIAAKRSGSFDFYERLDEDLFDSTSVEAQHRQA